MLYTYCVSTSNILTYFDDKNWYYYIRAKKKSDGTSIRSIDATSLTFFNSNIPLSWITTDQSQPFDSGLSIIGMKPFSNQYDESCSTDIYAEYVNSMNGKTYRTPTKRYYLYGYNVWPIYRYNSVINIDVTGVYFTGNSASINIADWFGKFSTGNADWWPMGVKLGTASNPTVTIGTTVSATTTILLSSSSVAISMEVSISKSNNKLNMALSLIPKKALTNSTGWTSKVYYIHLKNNFGSSYIRVQFTKAKKTEYTANPSKYSNPIITLPTPDF